MSDDDAKQSAARAARIAITAIYVWIAVEAVVIVAGLDYVAGGGYDVWFATSQVVAMAQLVGFAFFFLTGIFVLYWFYRAMAAAHRITPGLTISPGGAVGWFFVPIASLWKPYEAMVQIVEGSSPTPERRQPIRDLIVWWWGAWIARTFAGLFFRFMPNDQGMTQNFAVVMMVFAGLGVASAVAPQILIRGVSRLQAAHVDATIFD